MTGLPSESRFDDDLLSWTVSFNEVLTSVGITVFTPGDTEIMGTHYLI